MTPSEQGQNSRSGYHHQVEPQDWQRVQKLYAFCRARAIERVEYADQHRAPWKAAEERQTLFVIEAMNEQVRHHGETLLACAVPYLRAMAMRDANHDDFRGDWLGGTEHARRAWARAANSMPPNF